MSSKLSLNTTRRNNILSTLHTPDNVIYAGRNRKITQAEAWNRAKNFMTANALMQLKNVSKNIETATPKHAASILMSLNPSRQPTRRRRHRHSRKAKRGTRRR